MCLRSIVKPSSDQHPLFRMLCLNMSSRPHPHASHDQPADECGEVSNSVCVFRCVCVYVCVHVCVHAGLCANVCGHMHVCV